MFRLQDNHYIGLQAFVFIEVLVQLATILGGVNVAAIDVVAKVLPNGGEDDRTNSEVDQYATTSMQQPLILIVTLQLCNVVTIIMFCSHLLEQH
jgi:hypothetical protein